MVQQSWSGNDVQIRCERRRENGRVSPMLSTDQGGRRQSAWPAKDKMQGKTFLERKTASTDTQRTMTSGDRINDSARVKTVACNQDLGMWSLWRFRRKNIRFQRNPVGLAKVDD